MSEYMVVGEDNFVEALEDGKIVRVREDYARREGLPIIRKPRIYQLHERLSSQPKQSKEVLSRKAGCDYTKPLLDYLKNPDEWKSEQVMSELVDNFHWIIKLERRKRGLTRKQLAKLLGESEDAIKLIENGVLPSKDFVLINKIQQVLGINLRKDGKDFSEEITKKILEERQEKEREENAKEINASELVDDEIEILEEEE
ncbi:helix-turn-helix domain-containing protein [Candidatus Pacearchaeota archaeon]|nr:MAG: helix-turn-helix domain-containing protein [Candidatus Pacearchaeota archaeon]